MNIERGAVNTFLVNARGIASPAYYLLVFQQVITANNAAVNHQYSITVNTGSRAGPLMLQVEEKDSAVAVDGEVTLGAGDWTVEIYEQTLPDNLDASLALRLLWTELISVTSVGTDPPVYPPPGGGTCVGVDILDGDGNVIAHIDDGGTYIDTEMPYIIAIYADEAAVLADNATIPLNTQAIKITGSGRLYQGDGTSTSAQLIAGKWFTPGFVEDPTEGIQTTFEGSDVHVQIY